MNEVETTSNASIPVSFMNLGTFLHLNTTMKSQAILILFISLFLGCSSNESDCTHSFQAFLSGDTLASWEAITEESIETSNPKLAEFIRNAKRDSIEFFDREMFLKQLDNNVDVKSQRYNKLYIIEFNTTGEKNVCQKSLVFQCGSTSKIQNFVLTPSGWVAVNSRAITTTLLESLFNEFNSGRPNDEQYWGYNYGELLAITEIEEQIGQVKAYVSLNRKQYDIMAQITTLRDKNAE
ncbi:MAG: hypothetical protein V4721_00240 [Bacteroidota bacterium]